MSKHTLPPARTNEERLDRIVHLLEKMERRDAWRMWGSTIHGIISFIPLLLLLGSLWYVYQHGAELLRTVAAESAKQAAEYTKNQGTDWMKQLERMMKR